MASDDMTGMEDFDAFRRRARLWVESNLPEAGDTTLTDHELQALLFGGGFAGIAFPEQYGGAGLSLQHQKVFYDDAAVGYRTPVAFMVSIGMLGATLLDHGSELLKQRHLPRILRGDEEWIQLLSEPSGGSDMAGVLTRLTRDGDSYILNGAKMWSSGAKRSQWGMCLARNDWDAPKHRGLSMIAVPLQNTPGVVIESIRQANGAPADFCQEFFDDVVLPVENLIGEENHGWAVAQTLLFHERNATAGVAHGYGIGPRGGGEASFGARGFRALVEAARERGVTTDGALRQELADSYIERTVARFAGDRIMAGMRTGHFQGQWGSLLKLHLGADSSRQAKIALSVFGAGGVIWDGDNLIAENVGEGWLASRGIAIAGGSNEMQRNIVSERLLGLPREPSFDRDIPFNEVIRNRRNFKG